MDDYVTISKNLLQRIVLAANREDRRIKAIYIIPAGSATGSDDSFIFDCGEPGGVADSSR